MKILAFPFAGGNKHSLTYLGKYIPSEIELITFDYPGRGTRVRESLLYNIEDIVNDAFEKVLPFIQTGNYILYGHSMGALVTALLCEKIKKSGYKNPLKLIVSGRSAPSKEREKDNIANLPTDLFWKEVFSLNGTPKEFMDDPSLKEYFEPIIRADFKVVEEYIYKGNLELNIPIDVLYGTEELEDMGDINLWKKESSEPVTIYELKGDHFFIFEHGEYIADKLVGAFFQYQEAEY